MRTGQAITFENGHPLLEEVRPDSGDRTIRAAILSFAHQARPCVRPGYHRLARVELVAIADADEARGQRAVEPMAVSLLPRLSQLLQRADIEAVIVCSANARHHDMTIAAAAAGKQVLCEKPLATTRSRWAGDG